MNCKKVMGVTGPSGDIFSKAGSMDKARLQYLLERYLGNIATSEEKEDYERWYKHRQRENTSLFSDELSNTAIEFRESLLQSINEGIEEQEKHYSAVRNKYIYRRWVVAAGLITVVALTIFYFQFQNDYSNRRVTKNRGYTVNIRYNQSQLKDMSFSGKIKATDSLAHVLERIAVLYNLDIIQKQQEYIISKKTN